MDHDSASTQPDSQTFPALHLETTQRSSICRTCGDQFDYETQGIRIMGKVLSRTAPPSQCPDEGCRIEAAKQNAEYMRQIEAHDAAAEKYRCHSEYSSALPEMFWKPIQADGTPNPSVALPEHVIPALEEWSPYQSLSLCGPIGCGKTHQVAALMHRATEHRFSIQWHGIRPLIAAAQASIKRPNMESPRILASPCEPDVLVLDDWGVERPTDYAIEQIATVIELRYQAMRPVIVTFNGDHLGVLVDRAKDSGAKLAMERIVSRVVEMTTKRPGIMHRMTGDDRRTI